MNMWSAVPNIATANSQIAGGLGDARDLSMAAVRLKSRPRGIKGETGIEYFLENECKEF